MLVVASLLCLLMIAWLGSIKGVHFTEVAGRGSVGFLVVGASLILPFLGFRSVKTHRALHPWRALLSPAFITSFLPSVIILWLFLGACFVRFPGHIFESDSRKVSIGMTKAQVIKNVGPFDIATGDGNWETFRYYVQRPWGFDDRKFHIRFKGGKVVSAEFRRGIDADILTPE